MQSQNIMSTNVSPTSPTSVNDYSAPFGQICQSLEISDIKKKIIKQTKQKTTEKAGCEVSEKQVVKMMWSMWKPQEDQGKQLLTSLT